MKTNWPLTDTPLDKDVLNFSIKAGCLLSIPIFFTLYFFACSFSVHQEDYDREPSPWPIVDGAEFRFRFHGGSKDARNEDWAKQRISITVYGDQEVHKKVILEEMELRYGEGKSASLLEETVELDFGSENSEIPGSRRPGYIYYLHDREFEIPFIAGEEVELRVRGWLILVDGEKREADLRLKFLSRETYLLVLEGPFPFNGQLILREKYDPPIDYERIIKLMEAPDSAIDNGPSEVRKSNAK